MDSRDFARRLGIGRRDRKTSEASRLLQSRSYWLRGVGGQLVLIISVSIRCGSGSGDQRGNIDRWGDRVVAYFLAFLMVRCACLSPLFAEGISVRRLQSVANSGPVSGYSGLLSASLAPGSRHLTRSRHKGADRRQACTLRAKEHKRTLRKRRL